MGAECSNISPLQCRGSHFSPRVRGGSWTNGLWGTSSPRGLKWKPGKWPFPQWLRHASKSSGTKEKSPCPVDKGDRVLLGFRSMTKRADRNEVNWSKHSMLWFTNTMEFWSSLRICGNTHYILRRDGHLHSLACMCIFEGYWVTS